MKRWIAAMLVAATPVQADEDLIREYVLSNAEHTLWHESGHLLVSEFGLPVIGQEEDAVDAFATLMMLSDDDAARIERLLDVAELWMISHAADEAEGLEPAYYDEHDLDAQRGLRVVCFIAGEGPGRAHELIADWGLPEERAETCEDDYELALESWDVLLEPVYLADGEQRTPIAVHYGPGNSPWRRKIEEIGLLEYVAETLAASYRLEPGLEILAEDCDEPNAFWDPGDRRVTLCYELLEDFEALARLAIEARGDR